MGLHRTCQDLAGGHVLVRCRVIHKDEIRHIVALLCQAGHAQAGGRPEGHVAVRPESALEAEGSLAEGARDRDEVCFAHVLRGGERDLGLSSLGLVPLEVKAEVQPPLHTLRRRGSRAEAAHVVDLWEPPKRKLGGLEEVLEAHTRDILTTLDQQAVLIIHAHKPVRVAKGAEHELLGDAHPRLDEARLQAYAGPLPFDRR
mmetsp:Transcript_98240/g.273257  ORF Transcript_98240/g.273257 Transcript_98240/m.273257 type:complete len:201 (+) Transcript_98240:537-1139(+)